MTEFESANQAMCAGLLIGLLMRNGIEVRPDIGPHGDYSPVLFIRIPMDGEEEAEWIDVAVQVLP